MEPDITNPTSRVDTLNAPSFESLNNVSPAAAQPDFMQSLMKYMPMMSGGMSGIGALFSLFQNIQRMKQMSDLRKQYKNWQTAANQQLSTMVGDAASRGLSGSPNALAQLTASAYAPYQNMSLQGQQNTISPPAEAINPFDAYLKSLEAVRSAGANKPSDTGIKFNYNASKSGSTPFFEGMKAPSVVNSNNPLMNGPSSDINVP